MVGGEPTDLAAEPRFVYRSLAMLRHHLSQTRVATSSKIRAEYVSRRQGNTQAVAVLQSNLELWLAVRGPELQSLAEPSDETMRRAMVARAIRWPSSKRSTPAPRMAATSRNSAGIALQRSTHSRV